MGLIALMMPIPGTGGAPFFVAAAMMMGIGPVATAAGWSLHLITGLIAGAIFGTVVARVSSLHPRTGIRAAVLGAVTGIAVWLVFFMPLMIKLMPALTSMPMLIGGSFVAHLIFGLVLGGVTSAALPRGNIKCEVCGQTFSTREDLKEHGKAHVSSAASRPFAQHEIECQACGNTFKSQKELADHAKEAHPMPAR
jgi:uncharacterized C2H2 Zn-finger protein